MRMMCLAVEEGSLLDVAAEQQLEVFELVGQVLVVHRLQLGVRGCAHHRRKPIGDSVFSAVKDMPELHKNLEGVPTTSTPCEALFAAVKRRVVVEGVARHDSHMGVVMAKRDRTTEWARGLPEEQPFFSRPERILASLISRSSALASPCAARCCFIVVDPLRMCLRERSQN